MNPFLMRPVGLGGAAARVSRAGREVRAGKPLVSQARLRLQDINFGCPWPLRESPHLESARDHALAWMVEFGLTKDPEANEKMFRDWKLAECAAWFFPDASAEGVAVAADMMGWFFAPFDDQFDGELGRDPRRSAEVICDLIAILDMPEGAVPVASYPVALAFADLFRRSSRNMSAAWKARTRHHWKKYLVGQLGEVVNRHNGRKPDAVSHLRQRIATTSSDLLCDLSESLCGFELHDAAWHMPVMGELRQLAAEIISITNDLVSAEKEEASGDTDNNLLLILENQEGYSRPEALEKMRQMTHERFERFLRLEKQVPDIDDVLDHEDRIALRRYLQGLHDLVAGDNEWEHTSYRYVVNRPAQPRTVGTAEEGWSPPDPTEAALKDRPRPAPAAPSVGESVTVLRSLSRLGTPAALLASLRDAKAAEPGPTAPTVPAAAAPSASGDPLVLPALTGLGTQAARPFTLLGEERLSTIQSEK